MISKQISKIVVFHRKKSGLTQKQLADIAGVGKTAVFDVEKGKETVRLKTLLKILSALNIKLNLHSPLIHLMEEYDEES
ncbi:MAG: helix-turn-helix transcriptional regulator [Ignavibacteria bacterium]|nr:MAG: helix-turn-helix transcriptional regulator [Ignavibacteria bacterium]